MINLLSPLSTQSDHTNLLSDFSLIQHVHQSTCICYNSATLIDHVIFSDTLNISQSIQTIGVSNHNVQIVNFEVHTLCPVPRIMWTQSLKKCDWDKVRVALSNCFKVRCSVGSASC